MIDATTAVIGLLVAFASGGVTGWGLRKMREPRRVASPSPVMIAAATSALRIGLSTCRVRRGARMALAYLEGANRGR